MADRPLTNRKALTRLHCIKQLVEIPDTSHLFGEPGQLEEMAKRSAGWFHEHLRDGSHSH